MQLLTANVDRIRESKNFEIAESNDQFAKRFGERVPDVSEDASLGALVDELTLRTTEGNPGYEPDVRVWYRSLARIGFLRGELEKMKRVADREGVPLHMAIVPFLAPGADETGLDQVYEIVAHEARRAGIETIRIDQDFRSAGIERFIRPNGDPFHPNADGHRMMAESIARALEGNGTDG